MTDARDVDDDSADRPSAFELLGGEARVRALVDRFYDRMAMDERFEALHALHPKPLDNARDKLFWFLCGWLGGPDHYVERFGHPRLRARHLPYAIGSVERDQWMGCMLQAMQDEGVEPALAQRLAEALYGTADWMRNRPA